MSTIIAGGFDVLADAEAAVRRLEEAGVSRDDLCRFRINPAGEHNALPAGGDRDASPGAKKASGGAGKGADMGAAVGLVAGAAATPFLGPAGLVAGAGVGAYTGSLWGSLKEIDKERPAGHDDVRPAETLVAVNVDRDRPRSRRYRGDLRAKRRAPGRDRAGNLDRRRMGRLRPGELAAPRGRARLRRGRARAPEPEAICYRAAGRHAR